MTLAGPGEPHCGHVVGPVWKLDGESWACERLPDHDGDHATADGTWWVHEVCRPERHPEGSGR